METSRRISQLIVDLVNQVAATQSRVPNRGSGRNTPNSSAVEPSRASKEGLGNEHFAAIRPALFVFGRSDALAASVGQPGEEAQLDTYELRACAKRGAAMR